MGPLVFFFRTDGRFNRSRFWFGILALWIIGIPILAVLYYYGTVFRSGTGIVYGVLIFAWSHFALFVKRAQDRNMHYLWVAVFLVIITIIGYLPSSTMASMAPYSPGYVLAVLFLILLVLYFLFLIIYIGCLPGTRGPNRYGPDPLQRDEAASSQGN
ncbi:MAG: DUF805 domain-containing protein [Xanthobacteraceae bacterium]|nr:DUF805 domain-containing protein [Xanthobacteraceae bacterium]QYK45306.1 MAG: DUF805 domain-containing protein [Xanthobacteraceae bacterium]HMN50746.1 DUF805 domain-containing protein [Xanthobacteraceae bacterium]